MPVQRQRLEIDISTPAVVPEQIQRFATRAAIFQAHSRNQLKTGISYLRASQKCCGSETRDRPQSAKSKATRPVPER